MTLFVLKLVIFNDSIDLQFENILFISETLWVLKLVKSKEIKRESPSNNEDIKVT